MLKNETVSNNKVIFYLGLIILGGIIFRFSFAHFDLQLHGDNMQYFLNALDRSLGVEENLFPMHNPGWSSFLSFFFWVFKTENFLELMIIQKIISITISSLTVIPIYFLAKNFFPKKFSIIAGLIFIFEPRIIQNSTFGLTEPLYIIMITIAMVLILSSKKILK